MATQQQLMEQLVHLTDAVRDLAQRQVGSHPDGGPPTDADRIRQRVAFSYQALGLLTGRTSSATGREFDVPVVVALRRPGRILFRFLPAGADWVELRSGGTVENLRIQRRPDHESDDRDGDWDDLRHDDDDHDGEHRHHGRVYTHRFEDTDPIGSMVFLRGRHGPLVAFGPRLGPLILSTTHPNPPYPPFAGDPVDTSTEA
jgi:hypothetical protein